MKILSNVLSIIMPSLGLLGLCGLFFLPILLDFNMEISNQSYIDLFVQCPDQKPLIYKYLSDNKITHWECDRVMKAQKRCNVLKLKESL